MGPGGEDSGIGPLGMRFDEVGDAAPHLRWVGVHGEVCAVGYFGEFDAVAVELLQVGQRVVLVAIHEELRRGQSDEAFEEVTVVGQGDHGLEDGFNGGGSDFMGQGRGVEAAGVVAGLADPVGEQCEEHAVVAVGVADYLSAQEAVFG